MTVLVGLLATVVCLTSLFCVVKLLVRYRSGKPLLPPLPENPASWDGFDVASLFVLFIVCQALCVTVVQHFFPVGDEASADVLGYQLLANAIAMLVFTGVASLILRARGASWKSLGFQDEAPLTGLRLAGLTWVIIVPPLLALAAFLDRFVKPYSHPVVDFLQADRTAWAIGLVIVTAVVAAPIAEEFFFRRILQGWLEVKLGDWAVVVSAVCFGVAHLGHGLGWIPLIGFGLAAGYLVRRRGTILPSIVLHALFNGLSVVLLLMSDLN